MAEAEEAVGCLSILILGVLILVVFGASSDGPWANSLWYSVEYSVPFDAVQTDNKPINCDFLTAPIGYKGCSYKRYVQAFNGAGVLVAGDNAPRYGSDNKTGKPIYSNDGGKTWNWYYGDKPPERKPTRVTVSWVKAIGAN